jgi:hypothetical protein
MFGLEIAPRSCASLYRGRLFGRSSSVSCRCFLNTAWSKMVGVVMVVILTLDLYEVREWYESARLVGKVERKSQS